ncbi:PUB domain-containing protein [Ceratobasidium sp. AG-Ba]|nr:PUB domain-containing protein [Ceratobasidium sp. AG-Ba]
MSDTAENTVFQVLLKLSQNLLSDPENPKFREFKSTNATIQRSLINPKGAIEYAIEMGFRATVEDFQPKYVWHSTPENLVALRVGGEIIKEHVELAAAKEERSTKSKQTIAEEKAAAVKKALLAFEDDRKARKQLDARTKHYPPMSLMRPASQKPPQSPVFRTQGPGEALAGPVPRQGFNQESEDTILNEEKPIVDKEE